MTRILRDFISDESGATAIEYGLIAAGISLRANDHETSESEEFSLGA
jgi:hypothetical protein